jgi:hypothetical protein
VLDTGRDKLPYMLAQLGDEASPTADSEPYGWLEDPSLALDLSSERVYAEAFQMVGFTAANQICEILPKDHSDSR